jgi:biopolymer transport protein TolR
MAARLSSDEDEGINDINITPLVDVMLVLLIIFMVASAYIVKETIEVTLPKAATAGETPDTTLSFVIDSSGTYYLNGAAVDEAGITAACTAAAEKSADAQAMISADQNVKHGSVVHMIDLVRKAGLTRFAINVKLESITGK